MSEQAWATCSAWHTHEKQLAAVRQASFRHCTMRLALLVAMLLLVWPQPLGVRCFDWQYEMAVSAIEKHKLADIPVRAGPGLQLGLLRTCNAWPQPNTPATDRSTSRHRRHSVLYCGVLWCEHGMRGSVWTGLVPPSSVLTCCVACLNPDSCCCCCLCCCFNR